MRYHGVFHVCLHIELCNLCNTLGELPVNIGPLLLLVHSFTYRYDIPNQR